MMSPTSPDDLIRAAEAATLAGISQRRIVALINAGRLPATKTETWRGAPYLIRRGDLEKIEDRRPGRPRKTGGQN